MRNDDLTPREKPIEAGETAPLFALLDQDRNEWSLKAALDEVGPDGDVVLSFYPLDFTSVCSDEMTCLTREMERLTESGARVVGISCDSFAAHKAFAEQLGIKQTLLADMHREVCKAYGLYWADLNVASRGTVVVGGDGKVRWVQAREPGQAMDFEEVLATLS
jgi:peroxiredoxin